MPSDLAENLQSVSRRGYTRQRWGRCSVKKAGRAAVYVSDFLPTSLALPLTRQQQLREEQLLSAGELVAANASRRGRRRRGMTLLPGVLTAIPSGVRASRCGGGAPHMWSPQLRRRRRLKGKQKNPDATFNHRAHVSKFKRSILEERKAAFLSLAPDVRRDGHVEVHPAAAVVSGSELRTPSVDASTAPSSALLQLMHTLVKQLEMRHSGLHHAMRRKDYVRAGRYMAAIRRLKRRLGVTVLKWRATDGAEASVTLQLEDVGTPHSTPGLPRTPHACCATVHECDGDNLVDLGDEPNFVNFYPSLAQMGIGQHPLAARVDWRSGRYPRRLRADEVSCLREASLGDVLGRPLEKREKNYVAAFCTNIMTDDLDDLVFTVLQQQHYLQCRMKKEKPLQFKARQFYCTGLRETLKALRASTTRIPVVLLAADIETTAPVQVDEYGHENKSCAGVDSPVRNARRRTVHELGVQGTLEEIRTHCASRGIPLITCMSRRRLAYALFMKGCNVSSVLLHSAEGVHEDVRALRCYAQRLFEEYARIAAADGATSQVL